MKAMSVETIINNLGKFNAAIELRAGQIFSGKVLALYPNDIAKIQLAGRKVNAQLHTGLSLDQIYMFQVKPNKEGSLPLLEVIQKGSENEPLTNVLGMNKNNRQLNQLAQNLMDEQIPMTKELLTKAEKWMDSTSDLSKGIQAIKSMIYKDLPQTESVYKALYHVQKDQSLVEDLQELKQLSKDPINTVKSTVNVDKSIDLILSSTSRQTAVETVKQLFMLQTSPKTDMADQRMIQDLFRSMDLDALVKPTDSAFPEKGKWSDDAFLVETKLSMTKPEAEQYLQRLLSKLTHDQTEKITTLLQQSSQSINQKPQLKMMELIRHLGLTFEQDFTQNNTTETQRQHQLKHALIELLKHDVSSTLKEKAETVLHRITGQQLLHTSENQSMTSLFYQLPIQFDKWKSDLMMRWDTKRNNDGKIDEAFSRILFYLDLPFLKETLVDMNVQNRIVSIKVINDHHDLDPMIARFKPALKERLNDLDYTLSSFKLEKKKDSSVKNLQHQVMDRNYKGVDLSV